MLYHAGAGGAMGDTGFTGVLLPVGLVTAVVWFAILVIVWNHVERHQPGRMVVWLLWTLTLTTSAATVAERVNPTSAAAAKGFELVACVPLALALGAAVVGTPRPTRPHGTYGLLLLGTLAYSLVQVGSGIRNGQLPSGQVAATIAVTYLPALVWTLRGDRVDREQLLGLARRLSLFVIYASLVLAVVVPGVAYVGDRRLPLGPITGRLLGVAPHPNVLALVASLGLALSLRGTGRRGCHVLAATVVIVLAEPRAGTVVLVLALLVARLANTSVGGRLMTCAGVLLIVLAALIMSPNTLQEPAAVELADQTGDLNGRTVAWQTVTSAWPQRPFAGWGPFAFSQGTENPFGHSEQYVFHAHNQFFEAIAETGLLGLLAMLVVAAGLVGLAWSCRDDPRCVASLIVAVGAMMTEVPLTIHLYRYSFVITVAALIVVVAAGSRKQSPVTEGVLLDKSGASTPGAGTAPPHRHTAGEASLSSS